MITKLGNIYFHSEAFLEAFLLNSRNGFTINPNENHVNQSSIDEATISDPEEISH